MRTKFFITSLILFIGLGLNAQDNNNSSQPKTKEEVRAKQLEAKKARESETDAYDDYKGNTKLINITSNIYYLQGDEENMGVYLGENEFFLIDTQNEDEMPNSLKQIKRLNKKNSIDYVVNTSNYVKHSKSYNDLKKDGVKLLSSEPNFGNDIEKLKGSSSRISDITYSDVLTFNYANEEIKLIPVNNSGNTIVYFTKANVLFSGDLFQGKKYPLIDDKKGKSYKNINEALTVILSSIDDKTKVIPGKGEITNSSTVKSTQSMLGILYKKVYSQRLNGKTLEQVLAMDLARKSDSKGYGNGAVTSKMLITSLYNEIAKEMGPLDTRTPEERQLDRLKEMQKERDNKN